MIVYWRQQSTCKKFLILCIPVNFNIDSCTRKKLKDWKFERIYMYIVHVPRFLNAGVLIQTPWSWNAGAHGIFYTKYIMLASFASNDLWRHTRIHLGLKQCQNAVFCYQIYWRQLYIMQLCERRTFYRLIMFRDSKTSEDALNANASIY